MLPTVLTILDMILSTQQKLQHSTLVQIHGVFFLTGPLPFPWSCHIFTINDV